MKEAVGFVYYLRNLVNGKGYVGCTLNYVARWRRHIKLALDRQAEGALHSAIRKHGPELFTAELAWQGPARKMHAAEQRFIKKYRTFVGNGHGYNLTLGGEGAVGFHAPSETLRKKSENAKRQWADSKCRAKLLGGIRAVDHRPTPEVRKRISASLKLAFVEHPEWAVTNRRSTGMRMSAATRRQMSASAVEGWRKRRLSA